LQVQIGDGDATDTTYDACFAAGASATLANLPEVSSGVGFGSVGAGRLNGNNEVIVLNTNAQVAGEQGCIVGSVVTNNGTALAAECRIKSRDIGGTTRDRIELVLRNAATGAAFTVDGVNFTAGEYVIFPVVGFIK
jgi:hypothetical protein